MRANANGGGSALTVRLAPRRVDRGDVHVSDPPGQLRLSRRQSDLLPVPESRGRRTAIQVVALVAIAASCAYLLWRVTASMADTTLWLSVPLLMLEAHALLGLALFTHDLWNVDVRPAPTPGGAADRAVAALRVAILVPTYNETRSILLPTVAAAVATGHPHQTWVLDDGDRPWVRDMATELGARYRSRRDGAHAKAGNINDALPEVDADVVAVVDADHVVSSGFLEALLPYFADPGVAVVQSPQEFYNDSSFEHAAGPRGRVYAEQELFYRGLLAGRNRWGAAFWCGTNAAVRVAALASIGGVATESVTEDIQTTLRLHRAGWRTVHHNEVLAHGLAADDPRAFFIQRSRWGAGAMQVLHRDTPLVGGGLSLHQRLSYLSTLLGWFDSWRTIGYVLLPILTVLSGGVPLSAPWLVFLGIFGTTFVIQRVALRVLSRGRAPLLHSTLFEFVRLPASFASTLHLFGRGPTRFVVTPKAPSGDRSRSAPPALLGMLMGLTVIAGVYYVLTLQGLTVADYGNDWVAHGAALWLVVNGAFLLAATRRIRLLRFVGNRRGSWRFCTDLSVRVAETDAGRGGVLSADLLDVSIGGARLLVKVDDVQPDGLRPGAGIALRIPLEAGDVMTVPATVRAGWPGSDPATRCVGVHFELSTPEAARLALALYRPQDTHEPAARVPAPRSRPSGGTVPPNSTASDSSHLAATTSMTPVAPE